MSASVYNPEPSVCFNCLKICIDRCQALAEVGYDRDQKNDYELGPVFGEPQVVGIDDLDRDTFNVLEDNNRIEWIEHHHHIAGRYAHQISDYDFVFDQELIEGEIDEVSEIQAWERIAKY